MIGIPGTGLGGIFYGLLVLWMAVRELALTLAGHSSITRWRGVGRFSALLSAIALVFWLELLLLDALIAQGYAWQGLSAPSLALGSDVPLLALAPLGILAVLLLTMHGIRFTLGKASAR